MTECIDQQVGKSLLDSVGIEVGGGEPLRKRDGDRGIALRNLLLRLVENGFKNRGNVRLFGFETNPLFLHSADGKQVLDQAVEASGVSLHGSYGLAHHVAPHPAFA